jgi:hypothetical protein
MNIDLSKEFAKYDGREIEVVEKTEKLKLPNLGEFEVTSYNLKNNPDPIIEEFKAAVEAKGLSLRLWMPDSAGTMDVRTDRLNAYVAKAADGKYRLGGFGIG